MSPAYPHLVVNHLPVCGALVASILLAVAVRRRTLEGAVYGYAALIATALLAIVAFVTGNFAPPGLADVPGISRDNITFHQITALATMIVSVLVGLLASIPLVLTNIAARRGVLIAYLVVSIGLDAAFAFTASTGGAIRHTELLLR
jgi:hypothetical protein